MSRDPQVIREAIASWESTLRDAQVSISKLNDELDAPYIVFWNATVKQGKSQLEWAGIGTASQEQYRAGVDAVLRDAEKRHKRYCDTQQDHIEELNKQLEAKIDVAAYNMMHNERNQYRAEIDVLRSKLRSHEEAANAKNQGSTKDSFELGQTDLALEARRVYWIEVGESEHLARIASDASVLAWRKVVGLIWSQTR